MNNKQFDNLFNNTEYIVKAFNRIANEFYDGNFGTFNKTQFDLLMFNIYSEACRDNGILISDYQLSKELGVSQSVIRNFRKKEYLVYGQDLYWEKEFLNNACKPILKGESFVISIEDPNVQIEVQHYIEEHGGMVDMQLNSKLLTLSPLSYIDMLMDIQEKIDGGSKNYKAELLEQLNINFHDEKEIADKITAENFKSILKKKWPEVFIIAAKCFIPGKNILGNALTFALDMANTFLK